MTRKTWRHATLAMAAVAVLLLAACGGGEEAGTSDSPRRVEISATDFAFGPASVSITPGETIEFVVTNDGSIDHEFLVTNQADIDEHIAEGHEHEEEGMEGMEEMEMHEVELGVGETKSLVVTFPATAGELTRFACLIPGHYEAGMVGDISYSE